MGNLREAVRPGRRGDLGLGRWPSDFWRRIGLQNNNFYIAMVLVPIFTKKSQLRLFDVFITLKLESLVI